MLKVLMTVFFSLLIHLANSQEALKKTTPGTIFFSNQPFGNSSAGSKKSFSSGEFIYARLELSDKTLMEAFGLPKDGESSMTNKKDCYLHYTVTVFKDGEQQGQPNFWEFLYVWAKEKNNKGFNFDVLPEPAKSTSMLCGIEDFSSGISAGPLYHIINQERFPENGEYTIRVKLFQQSLNDWGKLDEEEKWPVMEEEFTFNFDAKDVKKLKTNGDVAGELIMENAYHIDKMPDWFYQVSKVSDPKASPAIISSVLKRDIPTKNILKFNIADFTGPLWVVQKDEYGFILGRYMMTSVNIAYKRDGKCYVGYVRLYEPYEGNGTYGTLRVRTESSSFHPDFWLDCSLVK
jgi:hypothetical protein